jgi:hypothetical protein
MWLLAYQRNLLPPYLGYREAMCSFKTLVSTYQTTNAIFQKNTIKIFKNKIIFIIRVYVDLIITFKKTLLLLQ